MKNVCLECRKFGAKLFLKGNRCTSPKCSFTRRSYKGGFHGAKGTFTRKSEYGLQLLEKQKAKAEYGLRERQFRKIFVEAAKSKRARGEEFLKLLESRLDNVIYRLGWAFSRAQGRQLITHGKIKVNNRINNIPSAKLKIKDKINPVDKDVIYPVKTNPPKWLKVSSQNNEAQVLHMPTREEIETDLDEQKILEFYSR